MYFSIVLFFYFKKKQNIENISWSLAPRSARTRLRIFKSVAVRWLMVCCGGWSARMLENQQETYGKQMEKL